MVLGYLCPYKQKERSKLWEELDQLADLCGSNWILGGDFNVIRWNSETSSSNPDKFSMKQFNSFIQNHQLIDPPLINGIYTWSNLRKQPMLSRLDRFLISPGWEQRFFIHHCRVLTRITFDHFSIMLEARTFPWGPSPFKLNNLWLKDETFKMNIENWWKENQQDGHPGYSFMMKLKHLAKITKAWQHNKKWLQDRDISLWRSEIEKIDAAEAQNSITKEDLDRRKALKHDLLDASIKEAQYWAQRAKRIWINEGDENTSFFHKVCTARRRRNQISSIYDKNDNNHNSNDDIQKNSLITSMVYMILRITSAAWLIILIRILKISQFRMISSLLSLRKNLEVQSSLSRVLKLLAQMASP